MRSTWEKLHASAQIYASLSENTISAKLRIIFNILAERKVGKYESPALTLSKFQGWRRSEQSK